MLDITSLWKITNESYNRKDDDNIIIRDISLYSLNIKTIECREKLKFHVWCKGLVKQ